MAEEIRHPDGRIEHPSVRTEKTDANFRWILGLLIAALGLGGLIFWAVLVFFFHYGAHLDDTRKSPFPLAQAPSQQLPPEPRLEQLERVAKVESANVYLRQASKEAELNSYGTTKEKGFVHIPIDKAMTLLAHKLPARTGHVALREHAVVGVTGLGLLGVGQGPFLAAATLSAGKTALPPRDTGLVDGGESNSGRLFQRRAQWHER